ncbi:unnamed protein product [Acanthosepion pharaonis]|uniref:Uncharacterized protein n=1 Tax=Acanthosepion pharaonis TaxID=158019 RepID=A0A812BF91_ACAPH|nr:unnamed protein product [Sepia pharaonis]
MTATLLSLKKKGRNISPLCSNLLICQMTDISLRSSSRPSPAADGTQHQQQHLFKQSFSGLTSESHLITTLRGSTHFTLCYWRHQLTSAATSPLLQLPVVSSSLQQLPAHSCTTSSLLQLPADSSSLQQLPARFCSYQQTPAHSSSFQLASAATSRLQLTPTVSSSLLQLLPVSSTLLQLPAISGTLLQRFTDVQRPVPTSGYRSRTNDLCRLTSHCSQIKTICP